MILRQGYSALYCSQKSNICRNPSMQQVKDLKTFDHGTQHITLFNKSRQLPAGIDATCKSSMILRQGYSALYFSQKSNICRNPSMQQVKDLKTFDHGTQHITLFNKSRQLPAGIDATCKSCMILRTV